MSSEILDAVFVNPSVANDDEDDGDLVKQVFEGTEEQILEWLKKTFDLDEDRLVQAFGTNIWIQVGDFERLFHVSVYLDADLRAAARDTPQRRRAAVLELVREAIEVGDPNAHADLITEKIMKLLQA